MTDEARAGDPIVAVRYHDDVLARQMAHTLRQAGRVPILAPDARAALRATRDLPEAVLLDLDVPEPSMEAVLAEFERGSGTARNPLLIVTGSREAVANVKRTGRAAVLLRKPVSYVHLRESVDTLLGPLHHPPRRRCNWIRCANGNSSSTSLPTGPTPWRCRSRDASASIACGQPARRPERP